MAGMRVSPRTTAVVTALILWAGASSAQHRDERVYRAVQAHRADALALLQEIVNIDSGTGDVEGGTRVESALAARLQALGADLQRVAPEAPDLPDNLVAVLHGTGRARILIIAHVDTVFASGTAASRPFSIEGDRALGPGVGDEKAGVVNAVAALEILRDLHFTNYASLTLLLDDSEERGSPGSTALIKRLAAASDVEFNMEPGDPPDALTVWRKGSTNIRLQVRGKAAHAGMAPQDGRNAASELVHQLSGLEGAFPHQGSGTTVNLTLLRAGERSNIIPDSAEATLNVRYRSSDDLESVFATVRQSAAAVAIPGTTVTVLRDPAYPPLTENPSIDALASRAQSIYAELGLRIERSGNGGASESALAMAEGTPALDGLGFVGGDFHTDHEWIDLKSVGPRMYLLARLLIDTCKSPPAKVAPDNR